jgi:hypothetical protein
MKYTDQSQINTLRNAGRITHAEAATARSEMRGETVEVGRHERVKLREPKKGMTLEEVRNLKKACQEMLAKSQCVMKEGQ